MSGFPSNTSSQLLSNGPSFDDEIRRVASPLLIEPPIGVTLVEAIPDSVNHA